MKWLEDLQKKTEAERRVVLWIATSAIFGVIFLIWVSTFSLPNAGTDTEEKVENEPFEMSPLDSLKEMSGGFIDDIKRGYGVFKGEMTELGDTTDSEETRAVQDEIPDIAASDRGFATSSQETLDAEEYDMMDATYESGTTSPEVSEATSTE